MDTFWPIPEDPTDATHAGQEVADLLFDLMDEEGLPREQAFCFVIHAKADKFVALPVGQELPFHITEQGWEPIGIVFGILVVEKKAVMLQARGFAKSERTDRILSEAQTKIALDIKAGKMMSKSKGN